MPDEQRIIRPTACDANAAPPARHELRPRSRAPKKKHPAALGMALPALQKVSIVMAAYNAAGHIRTAIDSVLAQSWPAWELIIVDDGSSDETTAIVQEYARRDRRIRLHEMGRNSGVSKARNAALELATGEWLTILDSDDAYHGDRLQMLLDTCLAGKLDIVADNIELYDEVADAVLAHGFTFAGDACLLTRELLAANDGPPRIASLGHLKPFVRRSLIEDAGLRYPTDITVGEDFYFLFCLLGLTPRAVLLKFAGYHYTLPYSALSGARAKGTRTAYDKSSLDHLAASNRALLEQANAVAPQNHELRGKLRKRGKALRDEYGWRAMRQFLRAGRLFSVLRQCAHLDVSFVREQITALVLRRLGRIDTVLRGAVGVELPASAGGQPVQRAALDSGQQALLEQAA